MKVLSAASEIYPLVKTGGLADVVGALPAALAGQGVAMRCLVPGYPSGDGGARRRQRCCTAMPISSAARPACCAGKADGLDLIAIDAPHLYDRPGNPYLGPDGKDWPDNAQRFAALSPGGGRCGARHQSPAISADVLHCMTGRRHWRPSM